ncbi:GspE/PulE family protein [Anaeromicrobium sediminis]|uniref:Type II secretion system protein GspE n=1 Tax=Anaeromicrobium sediminis TaxID=1478221 RepID=A0A267MG00_9FIRM|nr:GspE/PulE family protein [Anaeromicrobium sediminis]PAB58514.1 type II secretion system protein GspE [Anaeromicrobium sediminis]
MVEKRKRLGDLLINAGFITEEQLKEALKLQRTSGKKMGEILIDEGFVEENQMMEVLEIQLGIPHMDLEKQYIDFKIPRLINESLAKRHLIIPVKKESGKLIVAMTDPLNIFAMDDVRIATGLEVQPVIASRQNILNAIDRYYGNVRAEKAVEDFKNQYIKDDYTDIDEESINEINNAPVVRLVNSIIRQAVKAKASDIHIEPFESRVRVRFRVDGVLQEIMSPEKSTHSAIVTRIKIMGKMNIAEKRIPQDGRVETTVDGKEIDLRISVLPTVYGEKIVIRLLDRSNFFMSKSKLGFSTKNVELLERVIKNPTGIILVTGPTGSGKTTTLYTILRELNQLEKNIITVEDPVEYRLDGINQVQVNVKANMTFASALRSILRQDPDTIMVGEIRDSETAEIAVRASITGHLVLSTMHTNDSPSTIARIIDMGIEPYLVSSAIVGVISQRLVRKICNDCKDSYIPNETEKKLLNTTDDYTLYKGKGCSYCNGTGYKGRIAVHEIMTVNKDIRIHIDQRDSIDILREKAVEQGMVTLKESCKELVLAGVTTIEELTRVAYSID